MFTRQIKHTETNYYQGSLHKQYGKNRPNTRFSERFFRTLVLSLEICFELSQNDSWCSEAFKRPFLTISNAFLGGDLTCNTVYRCLKPFSQKNVHPFQRNVAEKSLFHRPGLGFSQNNLGEPNQKSEWAPIMCSMV